MVRVAVMAGMTKKAHQRAQDRYALLPQTSPEENATASVPVVHTSEAARSAVSEVEEWAEEVGRTGTCMPLTVLEEILDSNIAQVSTSAIILLNSIVIGMETDYTEWKGWDLVENAFLAFFFVELVVRIVAQTPCRYFSPMGADFMWNIFDFAIVSMGLFDFVMTTFATPAKPSVNHASGGDEEDSGEGSMKFTMIFRIVRLLRILRILKIIRFLKQLYLLAYGFVEAALAITWVTVLMTFVLYICGIVLTRLYGRVPKSDPDFPFLTERFGTVPGSMLTLFELMSQPDLTIYQDVLSNKPSLLPFLVIFIIFGSFGMIALLTGVISESMFEKNKARVEEDQKERDSKREVFIKACGELFESMEMTEFGTVSNAELQKHQKEIAQLIINGGTFANEREIEQLFNALDYDSSGGVDRKEFETGLSQMVEEIRPMSIMELHHCVRKCHILVEDVDKRLQTTDAKLDGLIKAFRRKFCVDIEVQPNPDNEVGPAASLRRSRTATRLKQAGAPMSPHATNASSEQPSEQTSHRAITRENSRVITRENSGLGVRLPSCRVCSLPEESSQEKATTSNSVARSRSLASITSGRSRASAASVRSGNYKSVAEEEEPEVQSVDQQLLSLATMRRASSTRSLGSSSPAPVAAVLPPCKEVSSAAPAATQTPESSASSRKADAESSPEALAEFRRKLEELAKQVQAEAQQVEEASDRMGALLALQAEHAARLDGCGARLRNASASVAIAGGSEPSEPPPETAVEAVAVHASARSCSSSCEGGS